MLDEAREFELPFLFKEQIAFDTYSFYFDLRANPGYSFAAGQYTRVWLDLPKKDPRGSVRMFTTSSSPIQRDKLAITTKVTSNPSIFKQKMIKLKKGEVVKFYGPMGGFVLPERHGRPLVFLAGGIGITPFNSMLHFANNINYPGLITLIVSFNFFNQVIFYDSLTQLVKDSSNFNIVYTLSQKETAPRSWKGDIGKISEELIRKYVSDIPGSEYFVSGPTGFVADIFDLLDEMEIPAGHVYGDHFTGY